VLTVVASRRPSLREVAEGLMVKVGVGVREVSLTT